MASGNTNEAPCQPGDAASGNTAPDDDASLGLLPLEYVAVLASYQQALRSAPLAAATRTKYVSRVRRYLAGSSLPG